MDTTTVITLIAVALGTLAIGFFVGVFYRKKIAEAKIGTAEAQARVIMEDAKKEAEQRKKEALLEAKEEIKASASSCGLYIQLSARTPEASSM